MSFIRLLSFERSAAGLLTEDDVLELEIALLAQPEAGTVIPGGRGLRKLRRPLAGRGKSGGARVIYYHLSASGHIYLIYAYAKNAQENLTPTQLRHLTQLLATQLP